MRHRVAIRLRTTFAMLCLLVTIVACPATAIGQTANPFFGDEADAIQQVSLTKEADLSPPASGQANAKQMRVSIRYLLVDDQVRREIYAELAPNSIRHSTYTPEDPPKDDLTIESGSDRCLKRLNAHGHSATCILHSTKANQILKLASESSDCTVSQAPSVILQQNRAAETNDTVQRPMVVDIQGEPGLRKPVIRLVDEGTRMRVLARLVRQTSGTDLIELTAEFVDTRILEIKTIEVLGLQDTPTTLQNPICESTAVVISEQLGPEQLLMIDPHIKKSTSVDVESTSMLGRLPVVGKAFIETESKTIENHLIVLIKPSIL
jgi:hypothetical protein